MPAPREGSAVPSAAATAAAVAGREKDGTLLGVSGLAVRFGGIVALDDVSFDVEEGEICGLIGPNGAGKTTLFNCLSRLYRPQRGDIRFAGRSLLDCPAHRIAALGIGRTFQSPALFDSMTVLDNVMVGAHARGTGTILADALALPAARHDERALGETARGMLAAVGLAAIAEQPVASQPFGTRKRIELARALASHPRLLLLDEPAGGLNHEEVAELATLIRQIRDRFTVTVLLVEHHMGFVMGLSDKVVALNFGRVIAQGTPDEVRNDAEVGHAYLGLGS